VTQKHCSTAASAGRTRRVCTRSTNAKGILLAVQKWSGGIGSLIVRSGSTEQNQEAGRERHVATHCRCGRHMPIAWHASGYYKSITSRVRSHAQHSLSDQECLAGNLIRKHGVRRNASPLVICECTQFLRCEGRGKMLQLFPTLLLSHLATTLFALS
jgi:hypothetical protein